MAERLAAVIPHSTLHIIDGAGHMVHYAVPQEIVHAVDAMALVQFVCSCTVGHFGEQKGRTMARFVGLDELFAGRHFDREIIVLCVRWYLRFKLTSGILRR
jgi:hypothetical protein